MWQRLDEHLGSDYARVWAEMTAIGDLGGRTVTEALADGVACKAIWRAVWSFLELPASQR